MWSDPKRISLHYEIFLRRRYIAMVHHCSKVTIQNESVEIVKTTFPSLIFPVKCVWVYISFVGIFKRKTIAVSIWRVSLEVRNCSDNTECPQY